MRVVVPIQQVLDPAGILVRRDIERVFVNREEYIIAPGDLNALEIALQLKDSVAAEIIAVAAGPARTEDALREALALGCDAAYLLSDEACIKADVAAHARSYAAAIGKIGGADLIIAGPRVGHALDGQIGPRLAALLDAAQVTGVYSATAVDGIVRVARAWDGRYVTVEAQLPAVLVVAEGCNTPRLPTGAACMSAYREQQVTTWNLEDLDLSAQDCIPVVKQEGGDRFGRPFEKEVITSAPAEAAKALLDSLRYQKVLHR